MARALAALCAVGVIGAAIVFFERTREAEPSPASSQNQRATSTVKISTMSSSTNRMPIPQPRPALSTTTPMPRPSSTGWKPAIATVFWVGEDAGDDNGYIHNSSSAWDGNWETHFGGVDDPDDRCGFMPCSFTPRENPFYVALPYNDLDDSGDRKPDARFIPWNDPESDGSVLKNRWVEVRRGETSCFGQWEDVGPFHEDDVAYVFGVATVPKNQYGEKAGIDLSPAIAACLELDGSDEVLWRHVNASAVPAGPWKEVVTTRPSQ